VLNESIFVIEKKDGGVQGCVSWDGCPANSNLKIICIGYHKWGLNKAL